MVERDCARIIELEGQPDSTSRSTMIVPFVLLVGGFLIIDSGISLCYSLYTLLFSLLRYFYILSNFIVFSIFFFFFIID